MTLQQRAAAALLGCTVLVLPAACSSGGDFCEVAADARTTISASGDQTMDEAATAWTGAGEEMGSVDAPDEIADEWAQMTATVVQVGEYFTSGTAEEKAADAAKAVMAEDYTTARDAVYAYVDQSCDA